MTLLANSRRPEEYKFVTVRRPNYRCNWLNHWFFSFMCVIAERWRFLLKRISTGSPGALEKPFLRFYHFDQKCFFEKNPLFFSLERA